MNLIGQDDIQDHSQQAGVPSLTLFASKRIFLIFSLSFALLIYGSFLGRNSNPITSSIAIFFFIFPLYFCAHHLVTNGYRLQITDRGLALTFFARTQVIPWADVKSIRVRWAAADGVSIPFNKRLFVNYRKDGRDRSLSIWPLFFNLSAQALVELMLPCCGEYPKLVETLRADSKDGITL
jgi:Bacterial PH domain